MVNNRVALIDVNRYTAAHQKLAIHHLLISIPLFPGFIEDVSQVATSTILTIVHGSHENASTTVGCRTLSAETLNLSITVNLVVLENSQLGLLALMLDLLWGSIDLLLALLSSTTETQDEMKCRLLLDVVVGEGAAVFELLASED